MRPLKRIDPLLPAHLYKTFAIRSPIKTHYRKVTCIEVDCQAYKNGWSFHVEAIGPYLAQQARMAGRRFREVKIAPGETYLAFEEGQPCFETHRVQYRPELYYVGRGDHRLFSIKRAAQHTRPEDWVDHMSNHLDKIHTAQRRG